ncbi:MAG: (2Fe-2S)-binding protein [Gammaproteobacteria bacterium]|nr:(2Fe-2S)-binding protein [Gammaproteobacteria bacterium]
MATKVADWRSEQAPPWAQPEVPPHKMEGSRYTDRGFFADEWEHMWTNVWLLLGRESEIPEPGDFQVEDVGPESIIMVRQKDGSVKAFYNACQHRGSRLLFADKGHVDNIVCPYHSWTYAWDGELTYVQDPEDFSGGNPCDDLSLVEVACETFCGWVWVNMNPDCESLEEYLGPVWEDWQAWQPDGWRRMTAISAWVPCNWKVIQDNFCESYHLLTVHPQLTANIEEGVPWTRFDMSHEGHNRMVMQGGMPSHRQEGGPEIVSPLLEQLDMWELKADDFKGREFDTRRAIQQQMRSLGPKRGYAHYDRLRDERLTDPHHFNIFPNCSVTFAADSVLLQRMRPDPLDPQRCRFDHWVYVSPESIEAGIFRSGRLEFTGDAEVNMIEYGDAPMGMVPDQDIGTTAGQQLGLRSRGYRGARLADQESRIARLHHVIDEYISGERPRASNAD